MGKKRLTQNTKVYFDELTHTYLNDKNEQLVGVTTLMKIMGVSPDYSNIPQEILDKAARRGTETHKAIEAHCKGLAQQIEEEFAEETILNLEAFKRLELKVLANEYLVSDNEHIASSIDMVLNDLTLVDIKTTYKVHWESVSWQLSIYKYLFELQNPKKKVKALQVLHLKDGKAELSDVQEIDRDRVVALLQAYKEGVSYVKPTTTDLIRPSVSDEEAIAMLQQIETTIVNLESQVKAAREKKEQFQQQIMQLMEKNNIKKWEVSPTLSFTYVAPQTRETLDSKRLKAEQPAIYEEFVKVSNVKAQLKINIKNV